MRILISGASGFIGTAVLHSLIKDNAGHQILSLSRNPSMGSFRDHQNLKYAQFDLSNLEKAKKMIDDFQPEVFIHLAWEGIPDFSSEISLKNLMQSINLLSFVLSMDSCRKVVVSGSCFEYENKIGECRETDVTEPYDFFTWSKLSLLDFLRLECNRLNKKYAWLRIFYAYGPRQRKESLIPMLIEKLENREIPNIRTPLNSNDYVYVDDVAEAFNICVNNEFKSGIYNLGSGSLTSVLDVSRQVEKLIFNDSELSDELASKTKQNKADSAFFASTSKAHKELNWLAKKSLSEGIHEVLNFSQKV